jgi:glucoside 3-dehydrogenase (cytochrome c) hitch-hiker subunit
MTKSPVTRRVALRTLGAGAGAMAVLPFLSDEGASAFALLQQTKAAPSLKVLSASQYATLEALAEAIIPADERSPGAREARVADYVDLFLSEGDVALRQGWTEGLAALDAEAQARFGSPFVRITPAQVEALLADASKVRPSGSTVPATTMEAFFATAKEATIYGYYTSEIGIHKELHYKGNQVLQEFVGCLTVDGKDCPHCGQKAEA